MRVTFVTQDDPIYIMPFFEAFLAQDLGDLKIASIFASRSMGTRSRTKLVRELLQLYGATGFVKLLGLQAWHRFASALSLGRGSGLCHSLSQLAESNRIPYRSIGNPNTAEHFGAIAAEEPEMLVSVACPFILKRRLLELPTRAAINIHHAPLPSYRGMMPTFWQMYHGERSAGITIHTMAEDLDCGEIVYQDAVPLIAGETMHCLIRRSKRLGARAMLQVLQQYARGEVPNPLPAQREPSYFTFPTPAEMRDFRDRGLRAI